MEQTDHDLLTRIDTRLERLERDFRDSQIGLVKDLAALDIRVQVIERSRERFDPAILVPKYDRTTQEWHDFKVRQGVWATVLVIVAAAISNLLRLYALPLLGIKP